MRSRLSVVLVVSVLAASLAAPAASWAEGVPARVSLPVSSSRVVVVDSVPAVERGSQVTDFERAFPSRRLAASGGRVVLELVRRPVYVLDGDTSVSAPPAEASPFGFHPANVPAPDPFAAAKDIGVRWHRGLYAYWILVQPTEDDVKRGAFDWRGNDREWGAVPPSMRILANFGLPERVLARPGPGRRADPAGALWRLTLPEEAYLRFVRTAVDRYDGDGKNDFPGLKSPIRTWQVENEPDLGGIGDWRGFAHLQEITYRAVKQECPEATVLMAGQTGDGIPAFERFYAPALKALGGRYVDVYDIHWYGDARRDWLGFRSVYAHVRKRLDEMGFRHTRIWVTEMGSYSGSPGDETSSPGFRVPHQSEAQQAMDVVKRHVFPLALGVEKVFWAFGLMEGFQHDDGYFDHTGFIYDGEFDRDPPRGTRKLAYFTYRKMTSLLDGADWSRARVLDLGPDVYAIRVPRGRGTVTIAWHDPPYAISDLLPGPVVRRIRDSLASLGGGPTTRENAAQRLRALREIIMTAVGEGGPAAVEDWAPRDQVMAAEAKVRRGDADAPAAVDGLLRRAREAFDAGR